MDAEKLSSRRASSENEISLTEKVILHAELSTSLGNVRLGIEILLIENLIHRMEMNTNPSELKNRNLTKIYKLAHSPSSNEHQLRRALPSHSKLHLDKITFKVSQWALIPRSLSSPI